jgi:hypothetical protein
MYQRRPIYMILALGASILFFFLKPELEEYRNNAKKKFEESKNKMVENSHRSHPSTFVKMAKARAWILSAANKERQQLLPPKVTLDVTMDNFLKFIGTMLKIIMDYC